MGFWSDLFRLNRVQQNTPIASSSAAMNEDVMKFKPTAPKSDIKNIDTSDNLVNPENLEKMAIGFTDANRLNTLTQIADRRDQRYAVYDAMRSNDPLAAAALEMYADDMTQPNDKGETIWIESDDPKCQEAATRLLNVLGIRDNIWDYAYSLVTYGDVYLELFRDTTKTTLFEAKKNDKNNEFMETLNMHPIPDKFVFDEYLEKIDDPSEMFDLQYRDKSIAFVKTHVNEFKIDKNNDAWGSWFTNLGYKFNRQDIDVYDSNKFVHIAIPEAGVRHPYKFIVNTNEIDKETGEEKVIAFSVNTGKSLLYDVYKISQQIQMLDNAIVLSRLTRSSLYRIIQVAIGQKSEKDAMSILNRIKSLFDKKQTMDTATGAFGSYNNPGPEVANIVLGVKENGQGGITSQNVGGDYDPKSMTDIDYLTNKELAGLKIPRQFLNFTDGGGFNGGSSLAKISSQYAHRITRYKRPLMLGIERVINIIFDNRYPDYVGNFKVCMTPVNTIEDLERIAMTKDKLDLVDSIMSTLNDCKDTIGKFKVLKDMLNEAVPNNELQQMLQKYILSLETAQSNKPTGDNDNPPDGGEGEGTSFRGGSSEMNSDLGGGIDLGGGEETTSETTTDSGNSEFPTDLSGEGVDMTDTSAVDEIVGDEGV